MDRGQKTHKANGEGTREESERVKERKDRTRVGGLTDGRLENEEEREEEDQLKDDGI